MTDMSLQVHPVIAPFRALALDEYSKRCVAEEELADAENKLVEAQRAVAVIRERVTVARAREEAVAQTLALAEQVFVPCGPAPEGATASEAKGERPAMRATVLEAFSDETWLTVGQVVDFVAQRRSDTTARAVRAMLSSLARSGVLLHPKARGPYKLSGRRADAD